MGKLTFFISIISALVLFSSCTEKPAPKSEVDTEHHDEHEDANTAELTDEQFKSIGIELGGIERKQLTSSLKVNGVLKVPNQNKANVTAMLGGVVKSIHVQTGTIVRKGQLIATITNPQFISMQEELIDVSSKTTLAELEYARQKELQEGNAGALKNLQMAGSELRSLRARKASLKKQLQLIGINTATLNAENIRSVVSVTSPINGSISNVIINIGSHVEANTPLVEIVDNTQLHLDLYVYEKDLAKMSVGQIVHFTLTNNPGKEYDARIFGISNTFEQETKAIAIHARVEGDKTGLIDGMSVTALVSLDNATLDAVPVDAIVSSNGQDYIFIMKEEGEHDHEGDGKHAHTGSVQFERIPVRKGTTDVGYSEIILLKDIPANSKVVIKGAFFILAKMTNQGEAHEH